ncbi:hypothetical protein ACRPM7_08295, partial [Burkholderia vietnamiensis]
MTIGVIIGPDVLPLTASDAARRPRCTAAAAPAVRAHPETGARMEQAKHFIAGEWTLPAQLEPIAVVDPSDGRPFATIARGT